MRSWNMTRPVKCIVLMDYPDSSLRPGLSELVPLRTRSRLTYEHMRRRMRVALQRMHECAGALYEQSREISRSGIVGFGAFKRGMASVLHYMHSMVRTIREGTVRTIDTSSRETMPSADQLIAEVRILRAQVRAQSQTLAELACVMLQERKRTDETNHHLEDCDRRHESRLLRVLQACEISEENWRFAEPAVPASSASDQTPHDFAHKQVGPY